MYPHGRNTLSLPALDRALIEHVSTVDKHFSTLNRRYLTVYGDVIEASRTPDPRQMLEYLALHSGMKDGMRIIDAGSGVCGPARYFASRFNVHIDAITATRLQHTIAEQKNKEAGLDAKITCVCGDFHVLSRFFPPATYDLVYFFESFCHAFDYHQVIHEVHKVLKRGGHVYMKDWFLADRLRKRNPARYENVKRRINEFYSFNFKDGVNELHSITKFMNASGFWVEFARTPGYESGDYELTSIFHGDHQELGPNTEYQHNDLSGDIRDVFDVIEIFELKAMKV